MANVETYPCASCNRIGQDGLKKINNKGLFAYAKALITDLAVDDYICADCSKQLFDPDESHTNMSWSQRIAALGSQDSTTSGVSLGSDRQKRVSPQRDEADSERAQKKRKTTPKMGPKSVMAALERRRQQKTNEKRSESQTQAMTSSENLIPQDRQLQTSSESLKSFENASPNANRSIRERRDLDRSFTEPHRIVRTTSASSELDSSQNSELSAVNSLRTHTPDSFDRMVSYGRESQRRRRFNMDPDDSTRDRWLGIPATGVIARNRLTSIVRPLAAVIGHDHTGSSASSSDIDPLAVLHPGAGPSSTVTSRPNALFSEISDLDPDDIVPLDKRIKPSQRKRMRNKPHPTKPNRTKPTETEDVNDYARGFGG